MLYTFQSFLIGQKYTYQSVLARILYIFQSFLRPKKYTFQSGGIKKPLGSDVLSCIIKLYIVSLTRDAGVLYEIPYYREYDDGGEEDEDECA